MAATRQESLIPFEINLSNNIDRKSLPFQMYKIYVNYQNRGKGKILTINVNLSNLIV